MKISAIETLCLSRMHEPEHEWITADARTVKADCAIVIVHTDQGVDGIGEASPYGIPHLIDEQVAQLAPALLGLDVHEAALRIRPRGRTDEHASYINPHDTAVAGLDTALWDLRAKQAGKPLCEVLKPGAQRRIPLYASSGCRYDWRNPRQLIQETLSYKERGFRACKVRIGTEWRWDGVTVERFLELMAELRDAVGAGMQLMVDGNQRLSVEQSFVLARGLDRLGFAWLEEPFGYAEVDAYARLNAGVEMPITGGEQFTTVEQFGPYLQRRCFDIVQPDVACTGISEALRIAEAADAHGVGVIPHNWHHGLMTMANAHYVAALPSPHSLELCMIQGPLQWAILAAPPRIVDGELELPERPGLGVDLSPNLAQQFPYIAGHYAVSNADRYAESGSQQPAE